MEKNINDENKKQQLAVTGITGKSGMYFLEEVLKHEDTILSRWDGIRFSTRRNFNAKKICELTKNSKIPFMALIGDTFEEEFCETLCTGCDTLLHIAGIHSSRIVVNGAVRAGIKYLITVHTTGIYSKYKSAGEEYRQTDAFVYEECKKHGITLTILRPTMIYGNLQDGNVSVFIRMVDCFPIMPTVNGAQYELQPVHCRDLGIAYYNVLINDKTRGKDYILSGGKPIELRKMFEVIAENLGVKRKYVSCPYPVAYIGAWCVFILTFGKRDYREKVQRLVEPRVYNHDEARKDFGYNPVNFEAGVVEEVKDYKRVKIKKNKQASYTQTLTFYESALKPFLDKSMSLAGLVLLFPLFVIISIAVYMDDPGPVFFKQKRVGKDGQFFSLHKFRTMKCSAPHDVPTHQLADPGQYITRVGHFLRKTSLDEIPQVWDIFRGKMSVIGPRPALWNQEDLIQEREKYGANSIMPGLTGWAQINGRDELEIPVKARLDGEYVKQLKQGGVNALFFDVKCFWGTIFSTMKAEGVVEGGTGELKKKEADVFRKADSQSGKARILVVCQYYYPENFQITPICESLVNDGYQVTVLTGLPNYPSGIVPEEFRHGHRDEYRNGVHIVRCYEAGRKKDAVHLAFNYITFTMAALKKVNELEGRFDLVLCYQLSPVFMGLPAKKYAKKYHIPFVLYCCDIWPESVKMYIKTEKNPMFRITKMVSKGIYQSADVIIAQSDSFINYISQTHGIPKKKITYIPAFADDVYLDLDFTPSDHTVDFVFLGNLGIAQDLMTVLKAVKRNRDLGKFKVHFVGDGVCLGQMKAFVQKESLERIVKFYGRRPVEEMPEFYRLADVCLVSLKADNATGLTLPSKVQGYMAAGKPIIGMLDGSGRDVINRSGCGICVKAGDVKGLAGAMRAFVLHPEAYKECGQKGRAYFKENFTREICIRKLEKVIDTVRR